MQKNASSVTDGRLCVPRRSFERLRTGLVMPDVQPREDPVSSPFKQTPQLGPAEFPIRLHCPSNIQDTL
ncbi:rCG21888, partial [Rattus norvegicus]